jgi:lipopolysaccharide/colanic/teichoic acid biosynthesis glycosyltransferase
LIQANVDELHRRPYVAPFAFGNGTYSTNIAIVAPWPRAVPRPEGLRRALNVAVALLALLVLLPVLLIIAVLIKMTSPGPVIYTQLRVGIDRRGTDGGNWRRKVDYGGRLFSIYKFRTMHVDADAQEVWASEEDPRVTRVGRFLRKYRLDELPQLVNVIRGDMNIVGPRPEQPTIFMSLRTRLDEYPVRQRVLPGITGLAQVSQPYDRCLDDVRRKLEYDLEYAKQVSAMEDLRIMLRTLPVMISGKGSL